MADFPQNIRQNSFEKKTDNSFSRGSFHEEKQTYLLEEILETQKELLVIEKKRLNTSRIKFVTLFIKFLVVIWFMWVGFTQMKDFTENLFEKFMNPKNMISQLGDLGGSSDVGKNLIKNSGEFDINSALNSLNQLQEILGK